MTTLSEAAALLSAAGSSKGGKARAESLSGKRRSQIASKAARARWKNAKLEHVGNIGVDAGMVMVGDPCYSLFVANDEAIPGDPLPPFINSFGATWEEFCHKLGDDDSVRIGDGLAIVIGGFGGDGIFPAYIKRDSSGQVSELVVKFKRQAGSNLK